MASIRITLKRRTKGGPGSGNWGHSGRPGAVGGSAPRGHSMSIRTGADWQKRYESKTGRKPTGEAAPKKDPDQERLENYFAAQSNINRLNTEVGRAKDAVKQAERNLRDGYDREYEKKYITTLESRRTEADRNLATSNQELTAAKKKMTADYKGVKAPAHGEWKRTEKPATKHMAGSSASYHVPGRPELGEVIFYRFGGYSMQRVAPQSSITYNGYKFEWSGSTASDRATKLLKDVFGVGIN